MTHHKILLIAATYDAATAVAGMLGLKDKVRCCGMGAALAGPCFDRIIVAAEPADDRERAWLKNVTHTRIHRHSTIVPLWEYLKEPNKEDCDVSTG